MVEKPNAGLAVASACAIKVNLDLNLGLIGFAKDLCAAHDWLLWIDAALIGPQGGVAKQFNLRRLARLNDRRRLAKSVKI
jgi:hypothetical protein